MTIVNVCTPSFDPCDSYGRIANELSAWLEQHGHLVNHYGMNAPVQAIRPATGGILLGYPTLHKQFGALVNRGVRVALTMFESTLLPDGWSDALNKCDAVIVPSNFLVDIFKANGVTVPIIVVPLGISEAFRHVRQRPDDGPLTFLAIGDRGLRKGWSKAVLMFNRVFGDDMNYRLIIKARDFPANFTNPNIEVIREDYTDEQMAELYGRCHVMIFPSCGEGFGLPPREFAATGGVVMATNWGGTADQLKYWGLSLPYRMIPAWSDRIDWQKVLGQWSEVDNDSLALLIRDVADNYDSYQQFALQAARFVTERYQWSQFSESVFDIYQQIMERRYGYAYAVRNKQVAPSIGTG